MSSLENKIKGALYGFAIGDAMGATTEFMTSESIKKKYGQVTDIIGGGWLNLKPGEVTDDTQMMLCVCEAIEHAHKFGINEEENMLDRCCENFVKWYNSNPKDIGNCCRQVISSCAKHIYYEYWQVFAKNPQSLGNGSLMRTLPMILSGQSEDLAISQGRLTHNNIVCDAIIDIYCKNINKLICKGEFHSVADDLVSPEGHVIKTLNNAIYWSQKTNSLEEAIISAVNHGGDADTIAGITGSLVGALYGYEAIPQRWIDQLDAKVKKDLDKYAKLFEKLYEKVCTNTR